MSPSLLLDFDCLLFGRAIYSPRITIEIIFSHKHDSLRFEPHLIQIPLQSVEHNFLNGTSTSNIL